MTRFSSASHALHGIAHAAPPLPSSIRADRCGSFVGQEPPLAEVLADPVVHLVMRGDGVTQIELEAVIRRAQDGLRSGHCRRRAAFG